LILSATLLAAGCAAGSGAGPQDLAGHARLGASATAGAAGFPWPREASDAIACVRDGHDATGWKPPPDEDAFVEIDLQPWLGRRVRLDSLALGWDGTAPAPLVVELSRSCGGTVTDTLHMTDPGALLALDARAGCVRIRVPAAGQDGTVLRSLELVSRDPDVTVPAPVEENTDMRHADSGVVEGFYGVPWSHRERLAMIDHLGRLGLGTYLYAPKLDPLHRARWREPYPEVFLDRWGELAGRANRKNVRLLFGISPLIDYDFEDPADFEKLAAKCRRFLAAGAAGVALLADDIELEAEARVDGALGSRHAELAGRLRANLAADHPDLVFWFVPTAYSDARAGGFEDGWAYLEALAALHPDTAVMWTGTDTFCTALEASDLDRVRAATGRDPVIWDNFWANDGGDGLMGRILLAAYTGRGPDLPSVTRGIVFNPGIQGGLSRLQLAMGARYLDAPASSDPQDQRARAVEAELGYTMEEGGRTGDAEALGLVLALFEAHGMQTPRHAAMEEAVASLIERLPDGGVPLEEAGFLLTLFARMATLGTSIHHSSLHADLVDELVFPLQKIAREGEAGLQALDALGAKLSGDQAADALAAARSALDRSAECRFLFAPGTLAELIESVEKLTAEDRGFRAPARAGDPPACRAGDPFSWQPFAAGATLGAFGPPGVRIEGDTVLWTPPHAGSYDLVVTAATPDGWAFRMVGLVCE